MNRKTRALLLAFLTTAGGCFGEGSEGEGGPITGSPPPPPPPPGTSAGGIWVGELLAEINGRPETRSSRFVRALVTETGRFIWILDEPGEQIVGDFDVAGTALKSSFGLMWWEYPYWITQSADNWGLLMQLDGTVDERASLTGTFQSMQGSSEYVGTFSLVYDELYERDSSLATLSGIYTGTGDSLTIDATGALFYQSSVTDCVGNGSASLLYPAFNLYSLKITLKSCRGNDAARNGMSYTGLAYLADSGTGASSDVLELAMSAFVSHVPNEGYTGHFMWTLSVHR